MLSRELLGVTTVLPMEQLQAQENVEPRDYEWAEFNLPAELMDADVVERAAVVAEPNDNS